jgi:hypothetical protein
VGEFGATAGNFVKVLSSLGFVVDLDDDLRTVAKRLGSDPRAAPVVAMLRDVEAARNELDQGRDGQSARQAANARQPRQKVVEGRDTSPEAVQQFAADWIKRHGTERGVQTACANHFGLDPRTVKARLCR